LQLEINNPAIKGELAQIFVNSAELVDYIQADGTVTKTLFVRIPFRSIVAFRKISEKVVSHLETKFNWTVVVIANRNIVSQHGKSSACFPTTHSLLMSYSSSNL
jgi:hypothetical protein